LVLGSWFFDSTSYSLQAEALAEEKLSSAKQNYKEQSTKYQALNKKPLQTP
jgi:hypothetical protein